MKERPIRFNAPMVRALLNGSKTQTRRVMKLPPWVQAGEFDQDDDRWPVGMDGDGDWHRLTCPYGQPGDRLWVRETWQGPLLTDGDEFEAYRESPDDFKTPAYCEYAADGGPKPEFMTGDDQLVCRWRPSIHMPRWASRITLEVAAVRVERLHNITADDAMAEGVVQLADGGYAADKDGRHYHAASARHAYASLWEPINGPDSWDANPWVWVVEFRRLP